MGFNTPSKIQEKALPMLLADPSVFILLHCCCTVYACIVSFKGIHLTVINIMCKLVYIHVSCNWKLIVHVNYKKAIQLSLQEVQALIVSFVACLQPLLDQTT